MERTPDPITLDIAYEILNAEDGEYSETAIDLAYLLVSADLDSEPVEIPRGALVRHLDGTLYRVEHMGCLDSTYDGCTNGDHAITVVSADEWRYCLHTNDLTVVTIPHGASVDAHGCCY